ncbi:hypothetical protein N7526_001904 [Penicillium atrosanguineum]|nr:hypothetical protein N7526_001904 [Penicillium atrosanguineum]
MSSEGLFSVFKAAIAQQALQLNPWLSLEISELLHHYVEVSVPSLMPLTVDILKHFWIDLVLPEAQRHQFVMESIHAVAAFHLAYLRPPNARAYVRMAQKHYNLSMTNFRSSVTQIDGDNALAVLCFTFVQFLLGLLSPVSLEPSSCDIFESMFAALAGSQGFLNLQPAIYHFADHRMVADWLSAEVKYPRSATRATYMIPLLDELACINWASDYCEQEKEVCQKAITLLQLFFATIPLFPFEWPALFTWPAITEANFLDMIRTQHPIALVVLLHWYLPICRSSNHHWILARWEEPLVRSVVESIGPDWHFAVTDLLAKYSHSVFADSHVSANECLDHPVLGVSGGSMAQNLPIYIVHPSVRAYMSQRGNKGIP